MMMVVNPFPLVACTFIFKNFIFYGYLIIYPYFFYYKTYVMLLIYMQIHSVCQKSLETTDAFNVCWWF